MYSNLWNSSFQESEPDNLPTARVRERWGNLKAGRIKSLAGSNKIFSLVSKLLKIGYQGGLGHSGTTRMPSGLSWIILSKTLAIMENGGNA